MLHNFLYAPFPDPLHQQQYEQVRVALESEPNGPVSLLMSNFSVAEGAAWLDALVVRPHSITILMFVPGGGRLHIPALKHGVWQLGNQPLPGAAEHADNPFEQFRQQKAALIKWLAPQLSPEQANLQFITGVVVFAGPVTFGPEVEEQLSSQPDGSFHLLANVAQLPRRLKQLARPEIDLSDDDLVQWAHSLAEDAAELVAPKETAPAYTPASAVPKGVLGRLWGWLGAEDVLEDTPYGHSTEQVAANQAEKQRLEHLQVEAQRELRQQLQALEAREAQRERNMAALQAQLAQAPPVTIEAQALRDRLAVESQEKVALEEAIRASRAESEARNQALDAKIQQLGGLIEQLHARTVTAAPVGSTPSPAPYSSTSPAPTPGYSRLQLWRRRLPRIAVVRIVAIVGAASLLGLGLRGVSRLGANMLTPYQENGKWGFADESGKPLVAAKYSSVGGFQQERAVVEENGVYGMIDAAGKEVVSPAYDALNSYAEGYARVRVGDVYTFIDEQGEEFNTYYFNALDFSGGYAAVLNHQGWYYISGPEEPSKPPIMFREAYSFRDGLARVKMADGYTFITKDYLIDPAKGTAPFTRYESATDFEQGKAQVTQNGRPFTIDTDGEPVE